MFSRVSFCRVCSAVDACCTACASAACWSSTVCWGLGVMARTKAMARLAPSATSSGRDGLLTRSRAGAPCSRRAMASCRWTRWITALLVWNSHAVARRSLRLRRVSSTAAWCSGASWPEGDGEGDEQRDEAELGGDGAQRVLGDGRGPSRPGARRWRRSGRGDAAQTPAPKRFGEELLLPWAQRVEKRRFAGEHESPSERVTPGKVQDGRGGAPDRWRL